MQQSWQESMATDLDNGNSCCEHRRRICTYSRYVETPRHLIVEFNPAGTDYLVRTAAVHP